MKFAFPFHRSFKKEIRFWDAWWHLAHDPPTLRSEKGLEVAMRNEASEEFLHPFAQDCIEFVQCRGIETQTEWRAVPHPPAVRQTSNDPWNSLTLNTDGNH